MTRLLFLFMFLGFAASAQPKMVWPHHKKAVIVLTYDDALDSQLNNAIPQLDSAGFKGTFFLIGSDLNYLNIPKWREVAKKGHELANHTIYHPCVSTDDNPMGSQKYTPNTIVNEIAIMNAMLFALDGKTGRTYAYPCTETSVGGKGYVDTLRKSTQIKYARVGGDMDDAVITDFKNLDPLLVPSLGLEGGSTGDQLIAFAKKVEESSGMGIFMFHGIGGDYITTPTQSHRELVEYLKLHKKDIWVATFQEAMDYIAQAKGKS